MGAGNSKWKGKRGDQVMLDKKFEVSKWVEPEMVDNEIIWPLEDPGQWVSPVKEDK